MSVVYDPSLNLVVYPSWGEHSDLVVWNRQSKSIVAKFETKGKDSNYPLWSIDGKQLAIAAADQLYQVNDKWVEVDEWSIISRDGQVERLTHFGDYFTNAQIGFFAKWSPDGSKLAFWLETTPSLCSGFNLAILEIATKQVTNTCIPSRYDTLIPPIWSLNSQYVVAINASANPPQELLVDVEKKQAFDITDLTPKIGVIGWLALPP